MSAVATRVRGLAPWQPPWARFWLLEKGRSVLREFAQYLPMAVRHIFYRPVGAHGYDKTEQTYARLGDDLKRARRAGLIPFDAIRDAGHCNSWRHGLHRAYEPEARTQTPR
jgi:hypothetical protein